MKKQDQIKKSVEKSMQQKKELEQGNIQFGMFPLFLFQKKLPALTKKYKKQDARDAIVLYLLYVSLVCRISGHELYGIAYPSHDQITKMTGIHRSRIKILNEILVQEDMIEKFKIPHKGHTKNLYIPLYDF